MHIYIITITLCRFFPLLSGWFTSVQRLPALSARYVTDSRVSTAYREAMEEVTGLGKEKVVRNLKGIDGWRLGMDGSCWVS